MDDHSLQGTSFLLHRFLTDSAGHLLGSYVALGVMYVIDNVSHTPSTFSYKLAIALAGSYILADYLVARHFGNVKWFGSMALVAASLAGYSVFGVLMLLYSAIIESSSGVDVLLGWLFGSVIFLVPAVTVPVIVRLMAMPIVGVFRRRDNW